MTTPVTTPLTILGGGQLGRMLALAAIPIGVSVRSLDPAAGAPAGEVSDLVVGALDDVEAARSAARGAAAVTYEWEGVPADIVRAFAADGAKVHPSADALAASQDRLVEKEVFRALDIPVAPHAAVDSLEDLRTAVGQLGVPAILKTRRGGYDGKGQILISSPADATAAHAALAEAGPLILEARIPFTRELSIIAVRGADGDVRTWALTENVHRNGILRCSVAPADGATDTLQGVADHYVHRLLDHFDYVGVLALELFEVGDQLVANEMAPRVHNSGHWTIEGAITSQFENHVRAVLGWPLGDTSLRAPAAMRNCIGSMPTPARLLGLPDVHLHSYGKTVRPGRKVGHVTVLGVDRATLRERLDELDDRLPADDG